MASANAFEYFNGLVFFVLCLYVLVLAVFLIIRRRHVKRDVESRGLHLSDARDPLDESMFAFELTTRVEDVTQSSWYGMKILLAIYRFAMASFFFGFAVILNSIQYQYGIYYFTNWNALLVTLYFFLAFLASAVNIATMSFSGRSMEYRAGGLVLWSTPVRILAMAVHLCFEIAGATSFFVLLFDNIFLDPDDNNALFRAVGVLSVVTLVVELLLCTIRVRFDQFPAVVAFTMLYLMIMWPSVFTGILRDWPYSVFRTDRSQCFAYYLLVFVLDFVCYCLWYGVYRLKKRIMIRFNLGREAARLSEYFYDEGEEFDNLEGGEDVYGPAFAHVFRRAEASAVAQPSGYEMAQLYRQQQPTQQHPAPNDPNHAMYTDPNYFGRQESDSQQYDGMHNIPVRQASYVGDDPYAEFYGEDVGENRRYQEMARGGHAPAPFARDDSMRSEYSMYSTGSYSYYGDSSMNSFYDEQQHGSGGRAPAPMGIASSGQPEEEDPYLRQRRQYSTGSQIVDKPPPPGATHQAPSRVESNYGSGYYEYNPWHPDAILTPGVGGSGKQVDPNQQLPPPPPQDQQQQMRGPVPPTSCPFSAPEGVMKTVDEQRRESYYGSGYFEYSPWEGDGSVKEGTSRKPFQDPLAARQQQQQQRQEGPSTGPQVQLRQTPAREEQDAVAEEDEMRMDDLVARRIAKLGFSQKPVNRSWRESGSGDSQDAPAAGERSINISAASSGGGVLSSGASAGDDSSTSESLKLNELGDN